MADIVKGNIGNALHSVAPDHIVTTSNEIFDESKQEYQDVINRQLESISGYYTCDTAGSTAAKTVVAANYVLTSGGSIKIKMANKNTAASGVTLNINSTGAKALLYAGQPVTDGNTWDAGEVVEVYYDPTYNSNAGGFYANNVMGGAGDGVYDISAANDGATYNDLAAALGTDGANVPSGVRKGGMSVKYIDSTTDKYVQYRLMNTTWSTTVSDWSFCGDDVIVENSEWIRVVTDKDGKVLAGIKVDGSVEWSIGVPTPIKEYILEIISPEISGKSLIDSTFASAQSSMESLEFLQIVLDSDDKILEYIGVDGTHYINKLKNPNLEALKEDLEALEEDVEELKGALSPIKVLIIGDSYSQDGGNWVRPMMSYFPEGSSWISLAVSSASLKDHYADRNQYPYSDRPVSSDNTGNRNTFACQIEKLKRLMAGTDLDEGETQIYTSSADYPDVIIIEGGQNDSPDSDAKVEAYKSQFTKYVTNVYVSPPYGGTPELGNTYIKTPANEVDRTSFAGAYRYLCDELTTLFPNARIFFTTRSGLGYWMGDVTDISFKIAKQQRICADYCGVPIIDWHQDAQISVINNYPDGDGTQEHPYTVGTGVHGEDTSDSMHPTSRGGKKYGSLAALVIKQNFIKF